MNEHRLRSIAKSISWRAIATATTMALVFLHTREWTITLGVGALDILLKLLFYYWHERIWNLIGWGKEAKHPHPSSSSS